jgi:hypothetical protein
VIPALLQRRWRDRRTGREATSLLDLDDGRPLDPIGIATLLAYGGLVGERSLLVDVHAVIKPLILTAPVVHPADLSPDARADRLWTLLCDAVRAAVRGRSRVRAALSGGLDSRAIAAAAVAVDAPGLSFGTFGDFDAPDLAVAPEIARRLDRPHRISILSPDCALECEERVWTATDGTGGPASAPGAPTDRSWADECDVLLSGCSADVIWGDTVSSGPSPAQRLRKLGVSASPEDPVAPPAPPWVSPGGADAWVNLHTRQRAVTWNGVLPRLAHTPVVPVVWHPPLVAFASALPIADRAGRALVVRMLARHAPTIAGVRLVKTAGVHDLDRAWRGPVWGEALDAWTGDSPNEVAAFAVLGLDRRAVVRMVDQVRRGARSRASFLSRLRALRRWGLRRA